jgi:hypothetical protein
MIELIRYAFLAGAIVLGVAGLYLSALILAVGSVALHKYDMEEPE